MQTIRLHFLFLLTFSSLIFAQEQIGVAAAVNRNTTDLTLEQERKLVEAGYQIIQNHTIETDEIGKAQMLLLDGTAFSVGPNSSVVLDRFIYNPETAEGSLEVTARGLFRIVGGKVTKNQPALIRTDSATVGIRGGIGIVQTNGSQVNATFLYGEEMTVTPNCVDLDTFGDQCSSDFITTITEPGFSVTVESADSEPSEPEPITEESIEAVQDELEANEEEPAEEGSSSDETSSEESANDSSSAASPNEDSSDDSSVDESSSDDSVASDSSGEESDNEVTQETETETEVADADDGGSTEVDEELLDSSGVSDVSSDVAPDELSTADAFEVETEVDLVDVDESSAEEVAEEVAQTTQETTAEVVPIAEVEAAQNTQETPAEVAPIFEVETVELVESLDENTNEITLASFAVVNPGEQNFTVTVEGESSQAFAYNSESNSLEIIEALDHESQEAVELIVTFTSDNGDVQEFPLTFNVVDVDEPAAIATTLSNASFAENIAVGTTIGRVNVTDPEDSSVTYSLSGNGSDNFSIDNSGNISLASAFNYETASSYELTVVVDDGTNASTEVITVNVTDINETPTLTAALALNSVQENTATGTTIATSLAIDPEAGTITYSLSGTGSENFSVSSDGTVTLANALDYETTTVYEITLTASDGVNSVSDTLTINVGDINEAPTLTTTLAAANFAENVATGTTIATSSVSDPESSTITYSLSGTGSNNFSVDTKGNVTLANSLDYETTTSYTITLTASDGTNSVLETITINVIDVPEINALAVTLASSGVALAESSSLGTAVASSSINNPGSEIITYTLSGAGSENFSVDSSGNVTTNASFDYETAQSYALTLTATAGDTSVTDNFTVNIANEIEFTSALLRYSAAYNSASRNGFSATATRGPSGSNLLAYYLEQVGDNTSSSIRDADGSTGGTPCNCHTAGANATGENGGVYVNIGNSNTANVFYTFPLIVTDDQHANGNRPYIFRGNNAVYQSASVSNVSGGGTNVSINTSGIISGGRTGGRTFWFMTTDNTEDSFQINSPAGTYNFFEDQVTLAGLIFPDSWLENYLDGNKRVFAMAVSPIESFNVSTPWHQDYFYPNFIPINLWSYGDVGLNYCNAYVGYESECADLTPYGNLEILNNMYYYLWSRQLWQQNNVDTSRFRGTVIGDSAWNRVPEGQSLWWQVLNPNGVGVGLWVQISFKDSYDGASGSTTRDDQESLLNVVISNVDYRKNDTTRYTLGDTGMGMDGYHYWSYQGPTNADNDGLGVNYGTSAVECATSNETGCFWAWNDVTDSSFLGAMITSSDPYKSGDMTLSVNYNSNTDTFSTSSFNVAVLRTGIDGLDGQQYYSVALSGAEETNQWAPCNILGYCRTDSVFRASRFYESTASTYNGFFSGILEFDVSGAGNSQLAAMRSSNTLASFTFDTTNDDLQVVAPMTISAAPSNNYTSNWTTVDTGSMTLKFGDATNDEAKSAYISSEVFAAEIQDDGAQIDGSSGGSNNLTGVMVSYNTLDKEDSDLFHSTNASMPNTAYSTWGFWAMSSVDISPNAGAQNASVHLGTWVGGETLAQNEIPTSGTASMSGAAVMKVASRHLQTGTNYDVHKYTTTADVSATFNWGASGYSGTLEFSNYDNFNGIVVNAGFVDFTVAIAGTDHTYTGNSTDTLTNGWLGGATVAGALYGGTTPDESGGRITVNLYKSGDISTSEANDFYMAEGIYLLD